MKPFLKWAGNKFAIIERIQAVLPAGRRLLEPFAGSAAVFLNTSFEEAILSDINLDLINLYQHVKVEGAEFIDYCRSFFVPENNQAEQYYAFRQAFNVGAEPRLKAALFLYFNRHGYNGLCRYNNKGAFNVPFGKYTKPYFPQQEMEAFHRKIQGATLLHQDFISTMQMARPGDVIYCDPPYAPLTATANFTGYSSGGFGLAEQEKLAEMARSLAKRDISVIISNHDTMYTQNAYESAQIISFQVRRLISCKGDSRGQASELLALFGGGSAAIAGSLAG
jgi:DNA adenine methylase